MQVTLAKRYKGQRVAGWMMGEKLDGFRTLWTGSELVSRNGNRFNTPKWFTDSLPKGVTLDGELHAGRGNFNRVQSIVPKKVPVDAEWKSITFSVFDTPYALGDFKTRYAYCLGVVQVGPNLNITPHKDCWGVVHLAIFFLRLILQGAEGVMLRAPYAPYEHCRTRNLLKLKPRIEGPSLLASVGGALILLKKSLPFKLED